ncbi:MAG: tripartite tricarboxylate transporter substrate binding protein [Betaproteobacteria bacterium]|nr:tripartite tricarboxylate transporter substrate binding protein [Betaproteobacteria bacterium]
MFRKTGAFLCTTLLASLAPPAAAADGYPERPVRLVVPFAPGGGTDINARILAEPLGRALGQTVVVDNRPGAASIIGTEIVTKASPDGYTLLINAISLTINTAVYRKLPFDTRRDFSPISLVSDQPNILVAHPQLGAKTFREFVALAHSQPGKFTYGIPGPGTGVHLASELLLMKVKVEMISVPYKGTGPALTALLGKEISVYLSTFASALPHVKAGRLLGYAVTTAKRAGPLPDVPTVAESGVPDYEYATWYGLLAPAGTPRPIVDKLNTATVAALNSPELRRIFVAQGLNARPTTVVQFTKYIDSEIKKWSAVVRAANIPMR